MFRTTLPAPKQKYRIYNWKEYNEGLKTRGSLTIWLSEDVQSGWLYKGQHKRGGKIIYSQLAIQTCWVLRKVYHLPLRQTQGMIESIGRLMNIPWKVPDYSTLCRRGAGLKIPLAPTTSAFHLIVDSTGLKLYGEGEWKVRMHGWSKHRSWLKLHLGINRETQEIVMQLLTPHSTGSDAQAAISMLKLNNAPISSFTGDGGYDSGKLRKVLYDNNIAAIIPPPRGTPISNGEKPEKKGRDDDIYIIKTTGRSQWKQQTGYHKRSLIEVAMFRYKTIIGNKLKSRKSANQQTEARLGCSILNQMTRLGMPLSKKVA
jgi:hypothetical protein